MKLFNNIYILILGFIFININSCYTFSGASIHPDAKTINIGYFNNRSSYFNPSIAKEFTTSLQDRFIERTSLQLSNNSSDMNVNGEIISYVITPVNIQAGNQENGNLQIASQNRLTMTISVRYESKLEPEKSFEKTFSDFEDFSANLTESQAFNDLAPRINKKIIDQIFNTIAVDW